MTIHNAVYIYFPAFPSNSQKLRVYSNNFIPHSLCLVELQKNPVEGFSAGLVDDDDIYKWEVLIIGPPDTF